MKKIINVLILASLLVLCLYRYTKAQQWEKVVSKGFGEPSNDYAWSMSTFKGKLYVGTLNMLRGGEIWSSRTGKSGNWFKVYNARPGANLGIRNLYADGDRVLYACTVSAGEAKILRTTNGQKWNAVTISSDNSLAFRCIVRFKGYLYAGAGGGSAKLYRSQDGLNWSLVNTNLSATKVLDPTTGQMVINNTMIGELVVFKNQLYAFTWTRELRYRDIVERMFGYNLNKPEFLPTSPGAFEVFRSSDGLSWEKVVGKDDAYGNGMGFCLHDPANLANDVVTSATVFKGQLYLGTMNDQANSTIWRTSNGEQWTKVLDFFDLGELANYYVWRMISFQNKLFIGTMNVGPTTNPGVTGAQIWASDSGDADSFYNIVHNGFDAETWSDGAGLVIPKNIGIRTFAIFRGDLFVGTATIPSVPIPKENSSEDRRTIAGKDIGCEIWKMIQ